MRALRSRTLGNSCTSDVSMHKSSSKIIKKKTRSRRTRFSLSENSNKSSDNVSDETKKTVNTYEENSKNTTRRTRKSKLLENHVNYSKNNDTKGKDKDNYNTSLEKVNNKYLEASKEKSDKTSKLNEQENIGSMSKKQRKTNIDLSSTFSESPSINDVHKAIDTKDSKNLLNLSKKSLNLTKSSLTDEMKKYNTKNFSNLANQVSNIFSISLDNEDIPEGLFKLDTFSSDDNKTLTNSNDCIIINDSINVILDKSNTKNNAAVDLNSTYIKTNTTFEKIDTSLSEKCSSGEPSDKDPYQIDNTSGPWFVDDVSNEFSDKSKNDSVDRVILHKKPKSLDVTFDTPSKSSRKKWVKFETGSITESPILRNSTINFDSKSSKVICSSTPFEKKYPLTPAKLNKTSQSSKENNSIIVINSTSKKNSIHKAKAMPNFSLIHEKANAKTESIIEYSLRKKERAEKLLLGEKPDDCKENKKTHAVKSSQDLFGNIQVNKKDVKTPKKDTSQIENKIQSSIVKKSSSKNSPILKIKEFISRLPPLKKYKHNTSQNEKKTILTPKQDEKKSKMELSSNKAEKSKSMIIKPTENSLMLTSKGVKNTKYEFSFNTSKNKKPIIIKPTEKPTNLPKEHLKGSSNLNKVKKTPFIISKPKFGTGLFTFNKSATDKSEQKKIEEKPSSVFSKGHYLAIANKTKTKEKLGNLDNRRDQMKGVRTNRRFELLMQMRNNK